MQRYPKDVIDILTPLPDDDGDLLIWHCTVFPADPDIEARQIREWAASGMTVQEWAAWRSYDAARHVRSWWAHGMLLPATPFRGADEGND